MSENIFLIAAITLTCFCLAGLFLVMPALRPSTRERRILKAVRPATVQEVPLNRKQSVGAFFRSLLRFVRKRGGLPAGQDLQKRLGAAGLRQEWQADLFLAMRLLSPLAGATIGSLAPQNPLLWALIMGIM